MDYTKVVGYQGLPGSYSEEALKGYFGENINTYNVSTFEEVFEALNEKKIDYGVLPIENSSTGGIKEVYDLLRKYGFYIVGERCIKVNHNLVAIKGTKLEDVKEVYSHSQAFEQSSDFLKEHPEWKLIPYKNTAISANFVKENGKRTKASIASKRAAKLYDLDIIKENINHNVHNYTRFIIIGRELEINKKFDKVSIVVSTLHKPGELFKVLKFFAEKNINLLKIESRPVLEKPWEYFFYIDFQGNLGEDYIKEAANLLEKSSSYYKLLGNYNQDK